MTPRVERGTICLLYTSGHLVAEGFQIIGPNIFASNLDNALRGVVQAGDELDQGGFGRTCATDNANGLPRANMELNSAQGHEMCIRDSNNSIQENVKAMRVVKSYVREDYEKTKFGAAAEDVCQDFTRAERILALNNPMMQFCLYTCLLYTSRCV